MPYPLTLHPQKDKHRDCNTLGCIRLNEECTGWKTAAIKHAEAEARAIRYGRCMATLAGWFFATTVVLLLIVGSKACP